MAHQSGSNASFSIRPARLDDASDISAIHCSHVPKWYRTSGSEQYEVSYGSLSLEERWGFGGPWMSPETCSIHLNNLLLRRHLPFVAEADGRLVAEMELFIGREGELFGKNCHIGLLYVHREYTSRGVGIGLIRHARQIARDHGCDTLTVSAMPHNEAFYHKCGFTAGGTLVQILAPVSRYHVETAPLQPPLSKQSFTWGMAMPVGRLQSSAFHLFELGDSYALPAYANLDRRTFFLSISGSASMISWESASPAEATVYGWSSGADARDVIAAALKVLEPSGIKAASLLLAREDYDSIAWEINTTLLGTRSTLVYPL